MTFVGRAAVALEERVEKALEDEKLSAVKDGQIFAVEEERMGGESKTDEADVMAKDASDCALFVSTSCDANAEEGCSRLSMLSTSLSSSMTSPSKVK